MRNVTNLVSQHNHVTMCPQGAALPSHCTAASSAQKAWGSTLSCTDPAAILQHTRKTWCLNSFLLPFLPLAQIIMMGQTYEGMLLKYPGYIFILSCSNGDITGRACLQGTCFAKYRRWSATCSPSSVAKLTVSNHIHFIHIPTVSAPRFSNLSFPTQSQMLPKGLFQNRLCKKQRRLDIHFSTALSWSFNQFWHEMGCICWKSDSSRIQR